MQPISLSKTTEQLLIKKPYLAPVIRAKFTSKFSVFPYMGAVFIENPFISTDNYIN